MRSTIIAAVIWTRSDAGLTSIHTSANKPAENRMVAFRVRNWPSANNRIW